MNTQEELKIAFQELEQGTFIRTGRIVKPSKTFYQN